MSILKATLIGVIYDFEFNVLNLKVIQVQRRYYKNSKKSPLFLEYLFIKNIIDTYL